MADRCSFSVGDLIDNKYRVVKPLGEGAFGLVYLVQDQQGKKYALKMLKFWEVHPEIRNKLEMRFEMEYQTGLINSPYLVQSYGRGWVSGNPYMIMEFCPNGDLNKPNNLKNLDILAKQVLLGLKALHENGKVHRDLKPENVLVKENGYAALSDFGISGDRNKRLTERNIMGKPTQLMGTYGYMPPEQVNPPTGDATVLPTTDIFSFGVMLYLLLTGELPFGKLTNQNELVYYIKNVKEGKWNTTAIQNSKYFNVISRCLEPDYKRRAQSVDEVIRLLPTTSEIVDKEPLTPKATPIKEPQGYILRVMQGEDYGTTYSLSEIGHYPITIGRQDISVKNDIPIRETQSTYISRRHCTIDMDSGHYLLKDGQKTSFSWQRSTNGTYVNSAEVSDKGYYLVSGDIITIGDVKIRFEPIK